MIFFFTMYCFLLQVLLLSRRTNVCTTIFNLWDTHHSERRIEDYCSKGGKEEESRLIDSCECIVKSLRNGGSHLLQNAKEKTGKVASVNFVSEKIKRGIFGVRILICVMDLEYNLFLILITKMVICFN